MNRKVIIFDFDGTIADTFPTVVEIVNSLAKEFGYEPLGIEFISTLRHKRAQDIIKIFRIPIWRIPKMVFAVKELLSEKITEMPVFKGMPEVLKSLKNEGYILGILTSNNEEAVRAFVTRHNIAYFDFIHAEKDIFGKARVLKKIMKSHSYDVSKVIYVGDETRDVEAAKKASIKMIAVNWGFNAVEALEKQAPDYLIGSPQEILKIAKTF